MNPENEVGHTEEQTLVFLAFLNSRCLGTLVLAPLVKIRRKASRFPKDYPHDSFTSKNKKLTRLKKNQPTNSKPPPPPPTPSVARHCHFLFHVQVLPIHWKLLLLSTIKTSMRVFSSQVTTTSRESAERQ